MSSRIGGTPRVLVVRPGALGDTILSLPFLESIRLKNPAARITFLGTRAYGDLIPKWAEFRGVDDAGWLWLFEAETPAFAGQGDPYDTAYVVLNNPDDVIRNLTKSGVRSIIHTSSSPVPGEHVVEHILGGLGLALPKKAPALCHLASRRKKMIWIHPGSGGQRKCVPLSFLIRFVDALIDAHEWPRAVTVGEADAFLNHQPQWKTLVSAPRTCLLKQRPFLELCSALRPASLFIGNDSGIGHLAAALGIPSIIFFVSTAPSQWSPWVPTCQVREIDVRGKDLGPSYAEKLAFSVSDFVAGCERL
jgi:Glycosyltransferase family 9 (heptosyltransferase)